MNKRSSVSLGSQKPPLRRRRMLKTVFGVLVALVIAGFSATNSAALDRKSEQAIKHRRAAFALMSTYFSRLVQTVDEDRPFDASQVKRDALTLESLSRLPWEGFVAGTESGDSRARDDIWFEEDAFRKLANDLQTAASTLAKTAATGDLAALRSSVRATRDVCNACHKRFRKD